MRAIAMLASAGLAASALAAAGSGSGSGESGVLASWSFDESDGSSAHDGVGNRADPILGFFKRMPGVSGNALRLDGYTTSVVRAAKEAPRVGQAFSMEAWVAVGAYPWNWAPIIDQTRTGQAGYSFGIDAFGHFGLQVAVDGQVRSLVSTAPLPLRKWAYIAATFDSARGIALYLDGRPAGEMRVQGSFDPRPERTLLSGGFAIPFFPPAGSIRNIRFCTPSMPCSMSCASSIMNWRPRTSPRASTRGMRRASRLFRGPFFLPDRRARAASAPITRA